MYGKIYGASAKDVLGPTESILSSAIIFSGTVQFAILGLLTKGSTWAAVLVTAIGLSARNIALGGAIRPSLPEARARRFLLAWTVVDEAVGLALSAASSRVRVLVTAGLRFYIAWLGGTIFGSLIGPLSEFTEVSSAALPVLFVALASAMARSRGTVALRRCCRGDLGCEHRLTLPAAILACCSRPRRGDRLECGVSVTLLIVLGGITYLSRLAGTVLLPSPRGPIHRILERFPAPLFAALAAAALVDGTGSLEPLPVLTAMLVALVLATTRKLPIIALGGFLGYVIGIALS